MKQTAVEWLINELTILGHNFKLYNREINQAKQMEKDQIIEAYTHAYLIGEDFISIKYAKIQSEQYYNETYGWNDHIGEANEMV